MADYFRKNGKYTQKQFEEIIFTWCAGLLSQEPPSTEQPHGVRRVAQYNYMRENGGITFEVNGKLKVDFEKNTIPEYLEVYVVSLCKCNEECYVTYEKKNSKEIMNCDSKEIRLEVDPKDLEITKGDVLKYKSPEIKTLYNDFERSLKQFYGVYNDDKESLKQSNVIKFKYLVDAVSIKVQNKSICNVSVNESIKIYFYTHKLNKINKMLDKDNCRKKNLRNIAYLSTGGPLVYFELTLTPCEIEYAIDVIKQIADAKNGGNKKNE